MKVCVLGSGTMGAGIAQGFAEKGHDVILKDIEEKFRKKEETSSG